MKGDYLYMASMEKYTQSSVYAMLKHNERTAHSHSNPDIDSEKSNLNYRLSPERTCTDYDYFKQHIQEYKCMNRSDVIKMASWIITAPDDLAPSQEADFFRCCHEFLKKRYLPENEVQAIVHYDEVHTFIDPKTGQIKSSRPHLHYCFVPATPNKEGDFHICAKKILNRQDLRNFHQDLQRFINQSCDKNGNPIHATVYSGITKKAGGNRIVKELKRDSLTYSYERSFTF